MAVTEHHAVMPQSLPGGTQRPDPMTTPTLEFGELLSHLRTARYTQQMMAAQAKADEPPGPRDCPEQAGFVR
jgi:hypothetical protein